VVRAGLLECGSCERSLREKATFNTKFNSIIPEIAKWVEFDYRDTKQLNKINFRRMSFGPNDKLNQRASREL
jgi:hypothetical protein